MLYSLVVLAVLILGVWAYLFHGYISGSRWAWVKYKLGTLDSPFGDSREARLVVYKGWPDDIDDYRGLATRGNRVIRLREVLTKRNEAVRSLGGRFLDVIPPISETVYNELLPRDYQKVGNRRRATLAVEEMRGSGVEMLYLADAPSSVSPVCLLALTI